jgi:RES domain-containing protein
LKVYRICKARWADSSLSGEGARIAGGRWNTEGTALVCTSATISLALLETLVHIDPDNVPSDFVIVPIEIPDILGAPRVLSAAELPLDWRAMPFSQSTQTLGDTWVAARSELVLSVPSTVVPQERNLLINPSHPMVAQVVVEEALAFSFDPRLWK